MSNDSNSHDDIWAMIVGSEKPHMLVPFPRNDKDGEPLCELAMVVITAEESAIITAEAEKKVRKILKDNVAQNTEARRGYDDLYNSCVAEGLLFTCCKSKDNLKKSFFPSKDSILKVLNVDEMSILLNHYYTVQMELGPVIANLSEDEMLAWQERIIESGKENSIILNCCSAEVLKTLIIFLADQLKNLQISK